MMLVGMMLDFGAAVDAGGVIVAEVVPVVEAGGVVDPVFGAPERLEEMFAAAVEAPVNPVVAGGVAVFGATYGV